MAALSVCHPEMHTHTPSHTHILESPQTTMRIFLLDRFHSVDIWNSGKMCSKLKNCHFTLPVQCKEHLFVTSFSGYLKIGMIMHSQVSTKCVVLRVDQFEILPEEFAKSISFFLSEDILTFKSDNPNLEKISWRGESKDNIKTISYYNDQKFVFELNIEEFYSLVASISSSMLFTFLFKDVEICFFQSLIDDCQKQSEILEAFRKDKNCLSSYINCYCEKQMASLRNNNLNLSSILQTLFQNHHPIVKTILTLKDLRKNFLLD